MRKHNSTTTVVTGDASKLLKRRRELEERNQPIRKDSGRYISKYWEKEGIKSLSAAVMNELLIVSEIQLANINQKLILFSKP